MEEKTKNYVIIGGIATLVLSALGFGVYKLVKKKSHDTTSNKQKKKEEQKLVGKLIHYGSEGYVNVRSSPKVDNENWGKFDFSHNLIKQVSTNPVGSITERLKGEKGYFWYKIILHKAVEGKTEAYVREDAVVVKD